MVGGKRKEKRWEDTEEKEISETGRETGRLDAKM
jgi:hypothetical protein